VLVRLGWLVLLVAASCARSPEPVVRYHVSTRLLEHLPPSVGAWVGTECPIADQSRPALGCTAWIGRGKGIVKRAGAHPTMRFDIGEKERDRPIIVRVFSRENAGAPMELLPDPRIAIPRGSKASVIVPDFTRRNLPAGSVLFFWTRLAPLDTYLTKPVPVPKGSRLSVGLGLDPATRPLDVDAVEFTLTADAGAGERELLHTVIRTGTPEAARWQDHTVPLDAVAGEAVSFRFVARAQVRAGADPERIAVVPMWGAPEILTPKVGDEHPNVVLVSLDTLRGDFVGALGAELPLTPHIDALAAEGVVFENASTTFPSTTGAHLSMLTGLYPIRLGISDPGHRVQTDGVLLAEAIGRAGWRTGAVTEAVMLAIPVGFARGVSHYQENLESEPTEPPSYKVVHTMDAALAWLEASRDERFFLFVHTYAVHFPYAAPEEYQFTTWKDGAVERPIAEAPSKVKLRLRYAADVRQADAQVGRLIDAIRRLGLERDTVVVITSDHGEAFYEHYNKWGHGMMIFDEIMHVPLVFWAPGRLPAGQRVRTPVSLVDVPPTILELAGAAPLGDVDGESQVARMRGGPEDLDRVVYATSPPIAGLHENQLTARTLATKWLLTESDPPKLVAYDLLADPGEQRPLEDPALLARGQALFDGYRALRQKAMTPVEIPISDQTKEQLRALGYAE
jgi:arylsulfatase A-like enzyme